MKHDVGSTGTEKLIAQVVRMADLVDYQDGSVLSREIINRNIGTVMIFAFGQRRRVQEGTSRTGQMNYAFEQA
jgi:hypothetical protein